MHFLCGYNYSNVLYNSWWNNKNGCTFWQPCNGMTPKDCFFNIPQCSFWIKHCLVFSLPFFCALLKFWPTKAVFTCYALYQEEQEYKCLLDTAMCSLHLNIFSGNLLSLTPNEFLFSFYFPCVTIIILTQRY